MGGRVGEQQAVVYQSSTSNLLGVGAKSTLGATIWEIWTPRGGISDTEKNIKLPPPTRISPGELAIHGSQKIKA